VAQVDAGTKVGSVVGDPTVASGAAGDGQDVKVRPPVDVDAFPRPRLKGHSLPDLLGWLDREQARWAKQDPTADPELVCVAQALDGFAAMYGRRGNRRAIDDRSLVGDGQLVGRLQWSALMELLGGRPETTDPGVLLGVDPNDVVRALLGTPGSSAVVRTSRPNERQHVFLIVHDDTDPAGPRLRIVDPQRPDTLNYKVGLDTLKDRFLWELHLKTTTVALFNGHGQPATASSLLTRAATPPTTGPAGARDQVSTSRAGQGKQPEVSRGSPVWRLAAELVARRNHYPPVIGHDSRRLRAEHLAAVGHCQRLCGGRRRPRIWKWMGRQRGVVQPWVGAVAVASGTAGGDAVVTSGSRR
jgi:hypothetical protein